MFASITGLMRLSDAARVTPVNGGSAAKATGSGGELLSPLAERSRVSTDGAGACAVCLDCGHVAHRAVSSSSGVIGIGAPYTAQTTNSNTIIASIGRANSTCTMFLAKPFPNCVAGAACSRALYFG